MPPPKLDRDAEHALAVHPTDTLEIWPSQFHDGQRHNLTIRKSDGDNVFVLYAFTRQQLSTLSLLIAETLGQAPDLTLDHLREAHDLLARLLNQPRLTEPRKQVQYEQAPAMPRLYLIVGDPQTPFTEPPYSTDPRTYKLAISQEPITDDEFDREYRHRIKVFIDRGDALVFASHCTPGSHTCVVLELVDSKWIQDPEASLQLTEDVK